MSPYADFERAISSARSLAQSRSLVAGRTSPPKPLRDGALDDLHRTLYGTLHPAAELPPPRMEDEGEEEGDWIDRHAVTAAVVLLGAAALYAWTKRTKPVPLQGPADPPLPFAPPAQAATPNPVPPATSTTP